MNELSAPGLPHGCTWAPIQKLIDDSSALLVNISRLAGSRMAAKLDETMAKLNAIAHGAADHETWSQEYDENPTDAIWKQCVGKLRAVNVEALDEAIAACEREFENSKLVQEAFKLAPLVGYDAAGQKMIAREKCTKIEGTVMYIITQHANDAAVKRSQCDKQKRLLKKLEVDGKQFMHPRVRELMAEAIRVE